MEYTAGAGPSGLVTAKYLLDSEWGFKVSVYEMGETIGGTFVNKTYDATTLVSSKYITLFADLRCPPEEPEHMTAVSYVDYLKRYCDEFKLWSVIHFGKSVTSVRKEGGNFRVSHTGEKGTEVSEMFDYVVVCSGLHNVPKVPDFDGLESFPGKIIHSSEYKEPSIFSDKRVLVVGSGETGMPVLLCGNIIVCISLPAHGPNLPFPGDPAFLPSPPHSEQPWTLVTEQCGRPAQRWVCALGTASSACLP